MDKGNIKLDNILLNTYMYYVNDTKSKSDSIRTIGFMEGVLVSIDYFKPGQKFEYIQYVSTFLWFLKITTKETYQQYIVRHTTNYLTSKGLLK